MRFAFLAAALSFVGPLGASAQTVVDFDAPTAPCGFSLQTAPISAYVPVGVTFSNTTMKVVNECGLFGVSGHSSPNFLGWNTIATNASARIRLASARDSVSIAAGTSVSGSATVSVYDGAGTLLGSQTSTLGTALTTFTLPGPGIARIELSATAAAGVWDNLMLGQVTPESCGNGIREGTEECDDGNVALGDCCAPPCTFETAGTVCRGIGGDCDAAEVCTGSSGSCPPDGFASMGTTCRSAVGRACDVAETCTGASAACPPDRLASGGTCRPAAGLCDVEETCSGLEADCPPDVFLEAGISCRVPAGICDVGEVCDGSSAACPSDAFADVSTICREAFGVCDTAETCSGSSATCPTDAFAAGVECRAAAGECDVAETCSGSSGECPVDALAASSVECRAASGDCDMPETCSGDAADCPADELAVADTVCRASAGACDVAETCTGSSAACPSDALAVAGTICRPAADACDVEESCAGSEASCPPDVSGCGAGDGGVGADSGAGDGGTVLTEGGCGCSTVGARTHALAWLFVLAVLCTRRRRMRCGPARAAQVD